MKARHAFIAMLALGIGFASLAEAQRGGRRGGTRNAKARTGEQTEQFQGRGQRGPGEGPFAALELTAEQTEAIQALRESQRADREARRETGERPTQEEMEAIREAHRTAIAEILTEEQLAQLEELRANRPNWNGPEEEEAITPAAKPVGAAIESSSWAGIKSQVR